MHEQLGVSFAAGARLGQDDRTRLLGGKGAALARMVDLGLPVPPGFTFTTEACQAYLDRGWMPTMESELVRCLGDLEQGTAKVLGDRQQPLLVSVRSGSPISMPGMMDTVLNVGMTVEIAESLGEASEDSRFGWDTMRRFIQSYVSVVLHAPPELVRAVSLKHLGDDEGASLTAEALGSNTIALGEALAEQGYPVPTNPLKQLREAVGAVFTSWTCERAQTYRRLESIADDLYTAATVQMMAFGNLGEKSGTGVAFSRDPSTGEAGLMGDFLQGAQGEDVVAGTHQTMPISALGQLWPDIATELEQTSRLLEHDLGYLVDIEFTVEAGKFWLLQYRKGKHSPRAALRMAIDMADDPDFPLTRDEALERVQEILLNPPMMPSGGETSAAVEVLATGLAASPGRAIGTLYTSVEKAVAAEGRGEAVILVRRETSPSDIAGMAASKGILTTLGGQVSHAAVVARGWGLPAIVGAGDIEVLENGIQIGDRQVPTGTEITLDGSSGEVLLGAHHSPEIEAPEVAILRGWLRDVTSSTAPARTGRYTETATIETVSRVLGLKGMSDPVTIANVLGANVDEVAVVLEKLVDFKDAIAMPKERVRAAPILIERVNDWFAKAAGRIQDQIEVEMEAFHEVNDAFKTLVTDWQMRVIDGRQIINDHTDPDYDARIVERLASQIHETIAPIIHRTAQAEPRLIRYLDRLEIALATIKGGDSDMFTHPIKDSYHTVWFEFHEELIRLSGRQRTE